MMNTIEIMSDTKVPDFEPPAACVHRVLKQALSNSDNVLMTQDARRFIVRAVGIFIFYITHGANDFSRESKRQTIYTQDILNALKELGFEDFEKPLEEFLEGNPTAILAILLITFPNHLRCLNSLSKRST